MNYLDEDGPWKGVLSATVSAVWSAYYTMLKKTPGQLVFGRNMIFNIQHVADWESICQNKQRLINQNNKHENAKHVEHIFKKGSLYSCDKEQKTSTKHHTKVHLAYY